MERIRETGKIELPNFNPDTFCSTRSTDEDIIRNIQKVYQTYDYVVDPHTACGFQEIDPDSTTVVLATAHPAKFSSTIHKAIGIHPKHPTLERLREKQQVRYELDPDADEIRAFMLLNGVM
jgi:threonine synthase